MKWFHINNREREPSRMTQISISMCLVLFWIVSVRYATWILCSPLRVNENDVWNFVNESTAITFPPELQSRSICYEYFNSKVFMIFFFWGIGFSFSFFKLYIIFFVTPRVSTIDRAPCLMKRGSLVQIFPSPSSLGPKVTYKYFFFFFFKCYRI